MNLFECLFQVLEIHPYMNQFLTEVRGHRSILSSVQKCHLKMKTRNSIQLTARYDGVKVIYSFDYECCEILR